MGRLNLVRFFLPKMAYFWFFSSHINIISQYHGVFWPFFAHKIVPAKLKPFFSRDTAQFDVKVASALNCGVWSYQRWAGTWKNRVFGQFGQFLAVLGPFQFVLEAETFFANVYHISAGVCSIRTSYWHLLWEKQPKNLEKWHSRPISKKTVSTIFCFTIFLSSLQHSEPEKTKIGNGSSPKCFCRILIGVHSLLFFLTFWMHSVLMKYYN